MNYRFRSPYYVVDRLFGAAELRLGGNKAQVVRIERTDAARFHARSELSMSTSHIARLPRLATASERSTPKP